MRTNRLPKAHRLCSQTACDRLFLHRGAGQSALAYPLRAVWGARTTDTPASEPAVRFFISIPKKRLHKAVERVLMRRRVREAYRLLRPQMLPADGSEICMDVGFVYVADAPVEYAAVASAMKRLLKKMLKEPMAALPRKGEVGDTEDNPDGTGSHEQGC